MSLGLSDVTMASNNKDSSAKYRDVHAVSLPTLVQQKQRATKNVSKEEKEIFRAIPLEADSGGRPSYMPYGKLYFPRINRESKNDPYTELQAMFTVAQLDHENEHGPSGPAVNAVREYEVRQI